MPNDTELVQAALLVSIVGLTASGTLFVLFRPRRLHVGAVGWLIWAMLAIAIRSYARLRWTQPLDGWSVLVWWDLAAASCWKALASWRDIEPGRKR